MADFDSKLPIRGVSSDIQVGVADSADVRIDPAKEGGNLLSIKTNTDNLDVALSTRASEATLSSIDGNIDVALSTRASEATLAAISANIDVALSTRLADATFTARINTLGQKTMANSTPVVLASDQSAIPVTISGNQAVNLAQVGGVSVALGQTTMSASIPVVIASNQTAIPVTFSNATVELPQYNTASAVAANASSTQTYSPGSTVSFDGVEASASGQMKVEIQYGTTGAETTKAVLFTSKGSLNASLKLPNPITITNTMSIKVIRTNMDNQAMDVYSTILVH